LRKREKRRGDATKKPGNLLTLVISNRRQGAPYRPIGRQPEKHRWDATDVYIEIYKGRNWRLRAEEEVQSAGHDRNRDL
jgi:hypothetical protein